MTAANFEFINVTEGYTATSVKQSMTVTIRGPKLVVDEVEAHHIRVVVDASDKGDAVGMFTLAAQVHVDGFRQAGAVGSYSVLVQLSKTADAESV